VKCRKDDLGEVLLCVEGRELSIAEAELCDINNPLKY
jgi:hypothetical protein